MWERFRKDTRSSREDSLISRLRDRFQDIVDRHYDDLRRYARFLTARSPEADDLVQEAFLLTLDRLAAGHAFEGAVDRWLRGTLRNLVLAWWRKQRRFPELLAEGLADLAADAQDAASRLSDGAFQAALAKCLARLSPEDRQLIDRRYERGHRIADIAEALKQNAATLRTRLFRIRQALKACIERTLSAGGAS